MVVFSMYWCDQCLCGLLLGTFLHCKTMALVICWLLSSFQVYGQAVLAWVAGCIGNTGTY